MLSIIPLSAASEIDRLGGDGRTPLLGAEAAPVRLDDFERRIGQAVKIMIASAGTSRAGAAATTGALSNTSVSRGSRGKSMSLPAVVPSLDQSSRPASCPHQVAAQVEAAAPWVDRRPPGW